jgi:NADH dehydrogenase
MTDQTILVTGAAGVMGRRLVARLIANGARVRSLILPDDPGREALLALGSEIREGDVRDPATLEGVCAGVDTVYHLAAIIISHDPTAFTRINFEGTANMLAEADSREVRHFIYVSSASVTYPKRTPYAESKLAAEKLVSARKGEYTIIRPTLVYDEHGGQEVRMFLDSLRRFPVAPFVGAGDAYKRPVWSEDIVDGLARLAGNPVAYGKLYNFSGGEAIRIREFAHLLLAHHGADRPFLHVPVTLCRGIARVLALTMAKPPLTLSAIAGIVNDANLDPTEAMRDLGYRPIGVRDGLTRCFGSPAISHKAHAQPPQPAQDVQ